MVSEERGSAVVHISGEVDLTAREDLVRRLNQAASGNRNIIVDMSQTTFMDSTGLRALLELWRSQAAAGLELVLLNPSAPVLLTLRYARLDDVLTITHRDDPS